MIGLPEEFVLGRPYHCSWAKNRGMVWILVEFNEELNVCTLRTPKTKKEIYAKLSDLRDVNKTIQEIARKKQKSL